MYRVYRVYGVFRVSGPEALNAGVEGLGSRRVSALQGSKGSFMVP